MQGPWRAILLVGDEPYYARVGFARLPPGRVQFPGPVDQNRILGLSLKAGGLLNLSGQIRRAQSMIRSAPMARGWVTHVAAQQRMRSLTPELAGRCALSPFYPPRQQQRAHHQQQRQPRPAATAAAPAT